MKKKQLIFADPSNGDWFKMNFSKFNKSWFNRKKTSPKWMMALEKTIEDRKEKVFVIESEGKSTA